MLKARLPELKLRRVSDPRKFVGKWRLERLLRATGPTGPPPTRSGGASRPTNASLAHDALTPDQWLYLVRAHWGVENNNHHTLPLLVWAFEEDDRPWIKNDPQGMLAVLLLRRIAYTLLTLFRSVTQRSDEARAIPWKRLMRWVDRTLVALQPADVEGLRPRNVLYALD